MAARPSLRTGWCNMWWGLTSDSQRFRIVVLFCIFGLFAIPLVSAVDVFGPTVITTPGVYYLKNDILNNANNTIIDIQASDVTFDGEGRLIDGVSAPNSFGIKVGDYDRVSIRNVRVQDFNLGLQYEKTSQSSIQNSTFRNNTWGMNLFQCDNIQVNGNNIVENVELGVNVPFYEYGQTQKTISFISNNISINGNTGLFLHETNSAGTYERNSNYYLREITILTNIIANNGGFGVDLASIRDVDVINNQVFNNTNTGVNVARGTSTNPRDTIVSGNLISGNTAAGVYFYDVTNSRIEDNTIINQGGYGIHFQTYVKSNTVNNNTVTNNNAGLHLQDSTTTQNTIGNNTFSNNANYGVFFLNSGTNTFNHNVVSGNTNTGLKLSGSSSNTLTNCTISGNNINGVEFIGGSNSNTFRGNIVTNNTEQGIYISGSNSNTLSRNLVTGNGDKGIFAYQSQTNTIADNHFNNTNNFDLSTVMYANTWNTTYATGPNVIGGQYLGGNYWANPSDTGYSQTCTDSNGDGFCDNPYPLATNNTDNLPLHATKVTHSIVASAGTGGTISPSGTVPVDHGASQTFTITPLVGYQIQNVQVDGVSVGAVISYTFPNVITDHTISASFISVPVQTYNITASAGTGGTIAPSGVVTVALGGNQTFAISPNSGYVISDVLVDGSSVGAQNSYSFQNVTQDHTIAASFQEVGQVWYVTASAGTGGTISPSGSVAVGNGQSRAFTITANNCYGIADIVINGADHTGPQASPYTYTFANITSNKTIQASFAQKTYSIISSAGTGGSVNPSGTTMVHCGASQSYTINPDTGYRVSSVMVNGVNQGALRSYSFTNVQANQTISASFTPGSGDHAINATADKFTIIHPRGVSTYESGSNATYLTQAKPGSELQSIAVDNFTLPPLVSWTFTNITQDHNISTHGNYTPGQVHAFFSINETWGPAPLTVQFTDLSVGTPGSWNWQFGDSTNSTERNPQHTYLNPGVYTVTLRASNSQSGGIGVWNNAVTVTNGIVPKPTPTPEPGEITPAFTVSPTSGNTTTTFAFQDLSTGNPIAWEWQFGDGSVSTLQHPVHQYSSAGSYTVNLVAKNALYSGSISKPGCILVV